jgi:hypothetical protein
VARVWRHRAIAGRLLAARARARRILRRHSTGRELSRRERERRSVWWWRHCKRQRRRVGKWKHGWWRHGRHRRRGCSGGSQRKRWSDHRWRRWWSRRCWRLRRHGRSGRSRWLGWLGRRSLQAARAELFQPDRLLQRRSIVHRSDTDLLRLQRMRERLGLLRSGDHRVLVRRSGLLSRRGTDLFRSHSMLSVARL